MKNAVRWYSGHRVAVVASSRHSLNRRKYSCPPVSGRFYYCRISSLWYEIFILGAGGKKKPYRPGSSYPSFPFIIHIFHFPREVSVRFASNSKILRRTTAGRQTWKKKIPNICSFVWFGLSSLSSHRDLSDSFRGKTLIDKYFMYLCSLYTSVKRVGWNHRRVQEAII